MWGNNTKLTDDMLYEAVSNVYLNKKKGWEKLFQTINENATIHILRDVPHTFIKDTMERFGVNSDYIKTETDCGNTKKSSTDGGVIYIKIDEVKLPICWFEVKSSNSSTKGKGTRGQATGLITEQESRCRAWASVVNYKIKPLVAFMQGSDFNENRGTYNINRIELDLHTTANESPYKEENIDGVSWLFCQEKFTETELENIIRQTINTNVKKMMEILGNIK